MYIYELPYKINNELCRLLDCNDDWKELAGVHMKYSAFDIHVRKVTLYCKQYVTVFGFPH